MSKKLLVLISLICLSLSLISQQIQADIIVTDGFTPEFKDRLDPYYWNTKDSVSATRLVIGKQYGIVIGSNQITSEQQWINFTADSTDSQIYFRHHSAEYDNNSNVITELYIDLYEITSNIDTTPTYYDRIVLQIVYKQDQINYGVLAENIATIFIILVLIIVGTSFIIYTFRRYA
jgi:hypothetical protein